MSDNDAQQTVLVVGANRLHLRRRLVDVESGDEHLANVGEVQRVLEVSDADRLLHRRTVPCDHSPETNSLHFA